MSREQLCECCGKERDGCLRFREGWTQGSIYRPGDAVPSNGSSYVAIHPNQNDKPPSPNWALVAGKGDPGPAGPPGPLGPAGHDGPPGHSGISDAYTLIGETVELTNGRDIGSVTVPPGNYVIMAMIMFINFDNDTQSCSATITAAGNVLVENGTTLSENATDGSEGRLSLLAIATFSVPTTIVLSGRGFKVNNDQTTMVALPVGAFHSG